MKYLRLNYSHVFHSLRQTFNFSLKKMRVVNKHISIITGHNHNLKLTQVPNLEVIDGVGFCAGEMARYSPAHCGDRKVEDEVWYS